MGIAPNQFNQSRKRFRAFTDEKKFESLKQRIVMMKADISYCNLDKEALELIKVRLEDCQKIVSRRMR